MIAYVAVSGVLGVSGALMLALALVYRAPRMRERRINDNTNRKLRGAHVRKRLVLNMIWSGGLVFGFLYAGYAWLVVEAPAPWWRIGVSSAGILLLYDFLYYFLHRVAFHQWAPLRRVHAVHHAVKHPSALDSLYLHPLETFLGLALLMACVAVVGPVDLVTFAVVLFVYSTLNIIVHMGLSAPRFPFKAVSYLARKHDTHHTSMRGGNYASITPLWDIVFRTAE